MKKLTLKELKEMHDKAYVSGQTTRENGSDDLVFYHITQWDDGLLADSQLTYRGEFNQLKKAGRQILSDLAENPIQNDFFPADENRDDAAEIADGLYRSDDAHNTSIEAYEVGKQEAVVCGVGAWELYTKYATLKGEDSRQVIRRRPIYEAVNTVFWDPNARLLDKSDATYVSILRAYSPDAYKTLVEELTGEEVEGCDSGSFSSPEESYVFPWGGGEGERIYISEFYHRTKDKEKILTMADPFGQTTVLRRDELKEVMGEMIDAGFIIVEEKEVERYYVHKYIASGEEILSDDRIAGENIPIIPVYGEHAVVEGEEHYEGVTRCAKDPQRLRNFMMSYIADIVSKSPRRKPIFFPEQIKKFEHMYIDNGPDNNYPYLLQNRKTPMGEDLPIGPVAEMPDQPIPSALPPLLEYVAGAITDVADPGLPQDTIDPDVSGKAIMAMQARIDKQSTIYQLHYKHSKRRDAMVWASMAAEIYDTPRQTWITLPDGTRKSIQMMQAVIDEQTGEVVYLNDIRGVEFDVISRIGPDYSTQREQTIQRLLDMVAVMDPGNPMRDALIFKALQHVDGVDMDDIRRAARMQLILSGIQEPDTDEEKMALAQAQQSGNKPSADMVLALAEDKKGQAAIMREQREIAAMKTNTMNSITQRKIEAFKAQTDRMNTQIKAQESSATISQKKVETFGKSIDNTTKLAQIETSELLRMLKNAS